MKEKISKETQVEDDPDSALKHQECFERNEKSQGKTKDIQTNITHPVWRETWQEKGSNSAVRVRIKHKQTWKKQKKAFEKKKKNNEEYLPLKPPPPTGQGRDSDLKIHSFAIVLSVADIKQSTRWNHRWA